MEYVTSQKGKPQLCYDGYIYKKDRKREEKIYWRCVCTECPGRAVTTGDPAVEFRKSKEHNHAPDTATVEAKKGFERLKVAAQGHAKTSVILNEEIAKKISPSAQGDLPKESSLRRRVQRERRKNFPSLPLIPKDIDISGKYSQAESGEPWVIYDEMYGEDRIIIFSTPQNLQTLSLSKVWYGDGTFDVTPPLFCQLYTIHCDYMGRVLPHVFCLLPRKSRDVYETMFLAIRNRMQLTLPGFEPCLEVFRVDYETSAHLAAQAVFPGIQMECCFFHFSQANWRKLSNLGLRQLYIEDTDFALTVRMFTALAFLPTERIRVAFDELKENVPELLAEYATYFQHTYIGYYKSQNTQGIQMRLVWKEPLFPPKKWSVYQRVLDDDPRTTNFLEAWHRRFSTVTGESHPNIYKFVDVLVAEQATTEMRKNALVRGEKPNQPKKKDLARNKRIREIVETLDNRSTHEFLAGIAHNIHYVI